MRCVQPQRREFESCFWHNAHVFGSIWTMKNKCMKSKQYFSIGPLSKQLFSIVRATKSEFYHHIFDYVCACLLLPTCISPIRRSQTLSLYTRTLYCQVHCMCVKNIFSHANRMYIYYMPKVRQTVWRTGRERAWATRFLLLPLSFCIPRLEKLITASN